MLITMKQVKLVNSKKIFIFRGKTKLLRSVFSILLVWQLLILQCVFPFLTRPTSAAEEGGSSGAIQSTELENSRDVKNDSTNDQSGEDRINKEKLEREDHASIDKETAAKSESGKPAMDDAALKPDQAAKDEKKGVDDPTGEKDKSDAGNPLLGGAVVEQKKNHSADDKVSPGESAAMDDPKDDQAGLSADTEKNIPKAEAGGERVSQEPEIFWKTCSLNENEKALIGSGGKKCQDENNCDKMKACLQVGLDISSAAQIESAVDTTANTGNNKIENIADPLDLRDQARSNETALRDEAVKEDSIHSEGDESESAAVDPKGQQASSDGQSEPSKTALNAPSDKPIGDDEKISEISKTPDTSITTEDANAVSNVANEVNTTIVTNNGAELVQNINGDYEGDINLLEPFDELLQKADNLNKDNISNLNSIAVNLNNSAVVENNVTTAADTGNNEIAGAGGAAIATGDAGAQSNIVNIVNTTIIGNNWLFAVVNVFGSWAGNLIVPGSGLLAVPKTGDIALSSVDIDSSAEVENNVSTSANSGENKINAEGGNVALSTGESYAESNVKNVINTTTTSNNWFFLVINNMGSWVGNVLNWDQQKNDYDTVYSYKFDEKDAPTSDFRGWLVNLFGTSQVSVTNNVATSANTGGNEINNGGGSASINSGNAFAKTNVFNFINNNLIGNNWFFAEVNVMGRWVGDVEFAYPDLAVSLSGNQEKATRGDNLKYKITYKNIGKADCQNVTVGLNLSQAEEYQGDSSGKNPARSGNELEWNLAGLKPGEEKSFEVFAVVSSNLTSETKSLEADAAASTRTKEVKLGNNMASNSIKTYIVADATGVLVPLNEKEMENFASDNAGIAASASHAELKLNRSVSKNKIKMGNVAKHKILVKNTGDTAVKNITVTDTIRNKRGQVSEYSWDVEALAPSQEAEVKYGLIINPGSQEGDYANAAVAVGYDSDNNEVRSNESNVKIAIFNPTIETETNRSFYTYYYYSYGYDSSVIASGDEMVGIIPAANAASSDPSPGKVQGAWVNNTRSAPSWWMWLLAGSLYYAIIYWALLKRGRINS
ncbi:MAG: hypothetical protein WC858_01230 [Parcubacteria group bacterium]|jgi:uncharacterized repeat protein (TIGR01451 family)